MLPLVLVALQAIGETGAAQIGQDTSHNGVDGTEGCDGRVGASCRTEGCEGCCDDNLDSQTGVDHVVEDAVSARGLGLVAHYASVDSDVRGAAQQMAALCESGHTVDTGQGTEDQELVVGWDEGFWLGGADVPALAFHVNFPCSGAKGAVLAGVGGHRVSCHWWVGVFVTIEGSFDYPPQDILVSRVLSLSHGESFWTGKTGE